MYEQQINTTVLSGNRHKYQSWSLVNFIDILFGYSAPSEKLYCISFCREEPPSGRIKVSANKTLLKPRGTVPRHLSCESLTLSHHFTKTLLNPRLRRLRGTWFIDKRPFRCSKLLPITPINLADTFTKPNVNLPHTNQYQHGYDYY